MWIGRLIGYTLIAMLGGKFARTVGGTADAVWHQFPVARVYLFRRLVPKWAVGQAFGDLIFLRMDFQHDRTTITHELVHVEQWHRHGWQFAFRYLLASLGAGIKHGWACAYRQNKFEIEAYAREHEV